MDTAQARRWCRQQKYDQAAAMYARQIAAMDAWGPWDYYYYAYSLSKLREYAEGREISRRCIIAFPGFTQIRDVYGWCLYHLYVRPFIPGQSDEDDFRRAVEAIVKYTEQTAQSPYERAVWKMIDVLRRQKKATAEEIDSWLTLLNPNRLSLQPQEYVKDGEWLSGASYRERWYALKSGVLVKKGEYDACIAVCEEGLRIFTDFHYDNDIWFKYRIALCRLRLGDVDGAEREFSALLQYKQHWIIYRGLFYAGQAQKSLRKMKQYGAAALLLPGDMADKVQFLAEFADSLAGQEDLRTERARHYALALRIRQEKGWFVPEALRRQAATYEGQIPRKAELLRSLQAFWIRCRHDGEEEKQGFISAVLPGGRAGFIKEYGGPSYYFKRDALLGLDAEAGTYVTFFVEVGQDRFGGKASRWAVDIRKKESLF